MKMFLIHLIQNRVGATLVGIGAIAVVFAVELQGLFAIFVLYDSVTLGIEINSPGCLIGRIVWLTLKLL